MVNELYELPLEKVYKKYYAAGNGRCIYFTECRKEQCDGLFCNRAKLGKCYGNGEYPKVLVIGKEPVSEQKRITPTASLEEANNSHYRKTLYTLAAILKEEPGRASYSDLKKHEDLLDYFCLTNYFKCSFTETETKDGLKIAKRHSNVSTNSTMRNNCLKILLEEIDALKPNVVVVQGTSYADEFWKEIETRYGKSSLLKTDYKMDYEELTKHDHGPDGDSLYIVWAYHPTARGQYSWNNRLNYLKFILKKLRDFL